MFFVFNFTVGALVLRASKLSIQSRLYSFCNSINVFLKLLALEPLDIHIHRAVTFMYFQFQHVSATGYIPDSFQEATKSFSHLAFITQQNSS